MFGGCHLDTGQDVRVCESFDTVKGIWEDEFHFRKGVSVTFKRQIFAILTIITKTILGKKLERSALDTDLESVCNTLIVIS